MGEISLLDMFNIWLFIKLFVLVVLFFHFILSLLIIRQTSLMTQVLGTSISPFLKMATLVHAVAVALLFLLSFALV